jgi:hypothetical protein
MILTYSFPFTLELDLSIVLYTKHTRKCFPTYPKNIAMGLALDPFKYPLQMDPSKSVFNFLPSHAIRSLDRA